MKMKNCFIAFLSKKGREFLLQSKINVRWRLMYIKMWLCQLERILCTYNECDSWRTNLVPVRFLILKLLEFSNISNQIKGNFNWTQEKWMTFTIFKSLIYYLQPTLWQWHLTFIISIYIRPNKTLITKTLKKNKK